MKKRYILWWKEWCEMEKEMCDKTLKNCLVNFKCIKEKKSLQKQREGSKSCILYLVAFQSWECHKAKDAKPVFFIRAVG